MRTRLRWRLVGVCQRSETRLMVTESPVLKVIHEAETPSV